MSDTRCAIIEVDQLADHPDGLSWRAPAEQPSFSVPTRDGDRLDVADVDAIWFRRWNHPQRAVSELADVAQVEVVNRSCATTLLGGLLTSFDGGWMSRPEATRRAEFRLASVTLTSAASQAYAARTASASRVGGRPSSSARSSLSVSRSPAATDASMATMNSAVASSRPACCSAIT